MIRLEKCDQSCYDTLISWVDSAEALMQFAGPAFTFPLTKEQLEKSLSDNKRFAFKVVDVGTALPIGQAEIYLSEKSAYLGSILIGNKRLRGKGVGKGIVSQLLAYAFDVLAQTKVELNVFDWNTGAIKCYEKVGLCINPSKRATRKVSGQTWTAINMFIDKGKWQQLQQTEIKGF
ncbi:MAG: GNAT family N-acetyltransferase [Flavisolibacter sp.]